MTKQVQIIVSGNVQGVGFRYRVREFAQELGLVGYVKNLPDGKVEIIIEGLEEKIKELIKWCKEGYHYAKVDSVEVSWQQSTGEFHEIEIKF